jgi:subtilisin-like proprotein convertase family protein
MPLFKSLFSSPALRPLRRGLFVISLISITLWLSANLITLAQRRTAVRSTEHAPKSKQSNRPGRAKIATRQANRPQQMAADGSLIGQLWTGAEAVSETTAEIMERERQHPARRVRPRTEEHEQIKRRHLPQNPNALPGAQWPPVEDREAGQFTPSPLHPFTPSLSLAPQPVALNFTGATLAEVGSYPPDTMGAVGPTQFLLVINGRIRVFDKNTGARGPLDASTDVFFNSVRNGLNTVDPRVRYDRLSGRWFVLMINFREGFGNNRLLLAVSDGSVITSGTAWRFFFFQQNQVAPAGDDGLFADHPTLGIDAQALYIGVNQFQFTNNGPQDAYTSAFVVRKSSVLGTGNIVATAFRNLLDADGSGPFTPQGVDNYDPFATEGYFIGVDENYVGRLVLRRVTNPGGTPLLSPNIYLNVLTTSFPLTVRHAGNNKGANGYLDAVDDRLFAAHLRNGRLWTAHNIAVNNTGAVEGTLTRTAARWYEIGNLNTNAPQLIQAGTLFAESATNTFDERNYFIPSIMVTGQGHVALGFSTAGSNEFINAATAGRLATDPLGTLRAPTVFTSASTSYNPTYNRWGDYSYTSLDPCDDMTLWTIQQYCDSANSYGIRIAKLQAPPPATPIGVNPPSIPVGQASVNLTVTGSAANGAGFYDPGPDFGCRLSAQIGAGVLVNSATYLNPTTIQLNVSTVNATPGLKNITVSNPDGQTVTGNNLLTIGNCSYSVTPATQSFNSTGGNSTLNVTATTGCGWTAVSNDQFITVTSSNTGNGNGTVNFNVVANLTAARTGTLTVAGQTITITQSAGAGCSYAITPASKEFLAYGGRSAIQVIAPTGCGWAATASAAFIDVFLGDNGQGNGTVNFAVAPNTSPLARSGTITIGDKTFTITQEAQPFELAIDDGAFEMPTGTSNGGTTYRVNRLPPTGYPATLSAVSIFFPGNGGVKVGDSFDLLVGINPDGDANIDNTPFNSLAQQVTAINEFSVYTLPTPLTITQGDFVVGFRMTVEENVRPTALDTSSGSQKRSYRSLDGVAFAPHDSLTGATPGNYGIRARLIRPAKLLVKGGATLLAESCTPANNAIDPGETITINVTVQNLGANNTDNLVAALQPTGGVTTAGVTQNYGVIAPGAAATRSFTFIAGGACGNALTLTLNFNDNGQDLGVQSHSFQLGAPATTTTTISYTGAPVSIPDGDERGVNIPLTVSGFSGALADLNLRFDGTQCTTLSGATTVGLAHDWVGDLVIKLTSPKGTTVTLLNRPGGGDNNGRNFCQTLLDDDNANAPSIQQISSSLTSPVGPPYIGTFRPANPLAVFDGENPNGLWILNVADVDATATGTLRAFSLVLTGFACCQSSNQLAYESDVAPRPNGNGSVTASDWTLTGRFVAGLLSATNGSEFQRADSAPRDGLGDGRLTVADFTQAGRYAAGLDPLTLAGGPLAPSTLLLAQQPVRLATRAPEFTSPTRGNGELTLALTLAANGNENALGTSLRFDASRWQFVAATPGNAALQASLLLNTDRLSEGLLGLVLALPAGQHLTAGQAELVNFTFKAVPPTPAAPLALRFTDEVIARELVDAQARVLLTGNQLQLGVSFARPPAPRRDTRADSPRFSPLRQ